MEEQYIYLNAIRSLPSITDGGLRKILAAFSYEAKNAWDSAAPPAGVHLGPVFSKVWQNRHQLIPDVLKLTAILTEQKIRIITETDPDYPPLLLEIPDHPYFLYVRGTLPSPTMPLVSVVGSRKYTSYGKQACQALVRDLCRAGVGIVSGLALGIDKIAHETALKEDGYTLAVLGSGIDNTSITPHGHQAFGQTLLETGALVSEFPPGAQADKTTFPLRNRIVAGMTLGTLVIEAAEKSGTLITARLALEYNREVGAVPGSIFSSLCQGTNNLLKQGAIPVTHAQDLLQVLIPEIANPELEPPAVRTQNLTPLEAALVELLSYESLHIDELAKQTKASIPEVSATLMMLEIKKCTKHIGNQHYILLT